MNVRVLPLLLLLAVLFLPASAAGKDVWTQVRSKNFLLIGNAGEKDVRAVGFKLEQFRQAFRQILPSANFDSATPTTVIVFKDDVSYKPFKPVRAGGETADNVKGYFLPGDDVNYLTLALNADEKATYGTIFHEYVHFVVNNNFGRDRVPPWFNEGLAAYYQTFRLETEQSAVVGEPPGAHLRFLRREEQLIPLETLFNTDYYQLRNQGSHGASAFYSEAWALMHFFQHAEKGARRAQSSRFLELLLQGKPARAAFETAFQTDYATLETALKKYVAQNQFATAKYDFKNRLAPDFEMQSAPLGEAAANAYLGDLLQHDNRLDEAVSLLEQALAFDPDSAFAHAALGMTKVRKNDFETAARHLEKAVRLNVDNYLPQFFYAYALSREGMDASGYVRFYLPEKISKMAAALNRAIELNPHFPESYRLLAFINVVNNYDLNEAVALLKKASALAPGKQEYQLETAQIYLRQEKLQDARALAANVFAHAEKQAVRERAQLLLHNISRYEADLKRAKEIEENPFAPEPEPTPKLSDAELVNQSLNESLRRPRLGEQRAVGFLTEIDCADKQGAIVSIRAQTANQIMKFLVADFGKVRLIAFTAAASNTKFGCETVIKDQFVVATFRPNDTANTSAGQIVALEFMPDNFKLIQ